MTLHTQFAAADAEAAGGNLVQQWAVLVLAVEQEASLRDLRTPLPLHVQNPVHPCTWHRLQQRQQQHREEFR